LRIKEVKEVFEGEVTELTPVETEDFVSWAGWSAKGQPGLCVFLDQFISGKDERVFINFFLFHRLARMGKP